MRILAISAFVVVLSSFLPASGLGQTIPATIATSASTLAEAYGLFMFGRHLEREGDVDGAIRAYRHAAELDLHTGEILGELAALHARRNEADKAIRTANEALERAPENLTVNRVLGLVFAGQVRAGKSSAEKATRAIEHLEQAREAIPPDLDVELTLARLYLTVEESDKAIGVLEDVLEDAPGLGDARVLLSDTYERIGRVEDAITILEEVLGSGRPSSRELRRLAELYGRVDRWNDAVETYELAAAQNLRSRGIQRGLASALVQNGQPGRARDVLRQLSEAMPDDESVLYQLSQVELDLKNFAAAAAAARRLIEVEPKGISGFYALAEIYASQHDYRAMIDTLEAALNGQSRVSGQGRAPPYQIANLLGRIGFAHEQLQDYDDAIKTYARAVELLPLSLAYGARLVRAYLDAGRLAEAKEALESIKPHHVGNLTIARLEARVLGDGGNIADGLGIIRNALKKNDHEPMAHLALAAFYSSYQRFDDAVDVLESAEFRFPDNLSILFQLGAVLDQSDRSADAEREFRRILDKDTNHAATLNYLGYMLADRGERLEESVDLLERAIEIDPHNGAYLDSLGWAYFKLDRLGLAEINLRRASKQMVWNSVIQDHLGDLMFRIGRYDEAIVAWEAALVGDRADVAISAIERKIQEARQRPGR